MEVDLAKAIKIIVYICFEPRILLLDLSTHVGAHKNTYKDF